MKGGSNSPALRQMYDRWGQRIESQWQKDFLRNSAGGGGWAPLAASTVAADKYKKRSGRRLGILRITSALYLALFRNRAGHLFEITPKGVRVGVGGSARHPGSEISVAALAQIHNNGGGHVPKRTILTLPTPATTEQMKQDAREAVAEMLRRAV